jgi:hypothetical protein
MITPQRTKAHVRGVVIVDKRKRKAVDWWVNELKRAEVQRALVQ